MATALHTQHGAFLSELRSLGFTTVTRMSRVGNRETAARMRRGAHVLVAILPTARDTGAFLDFDTANARLTPFWDVPAECFSDTVRDHLSGTEVARMHGPDCVCVHPDAR